MARTLSSIIQNAIDNDDVKTAYLIRMGWATERRIATYDVDISWNSETWEDSGARVEGISPAGGRLILPNGEGDPWAALEHSEIARGRTIEIYQWYETISDSPIEADAIKLFEGTMDEAVTTIAGAIQIQFIESQQNKFFPPTSFGPPIHNHLLGKGTKLQYGDSVVVVN